MAYRLALKSGEARHVGDHPGLPGRPSVRDVFKLASSFLKLTAAKVTAAMAEGEHAARGARYRLRPRALISLSPEVVGNNLGGPVRR